MNLTADKRAEVLIDVLVKGDASPVLETEIRDWLSEEGNLTGKLKALEKAYNREIQADLKPDRTVYDSYLRLARRLDFPESVLPEARKQRLSARRMMWRAAALIVPLLVVAGVWFLTNRQQETRLVRMKPQGQFVEWSAEGAVKYLKLPCGSRIWLKEGSLYTQKMESNNRTVRLEGEAYFSVARDENRPFRVEVNGATVNVLGTEFLVSAHANTPGVEVSVSDGKVRVEVEDVQEPYVLERYDRLVYNQENGEIVQDLLDESRLREMKTIRLRFNYVKLSDAFESIADYYGVTLTVEGEIPDHEALRAAFDGTDSLGEVLYIIRHTALGIFDYEIRDDTVRIMTR